MLLFLLSDLSFRRLCRIFYVFRTILAARAIAICLDHTIYVLQGSVETTYSCEVGWKHDNCMVTNIRRDMNTDNNENNSIFIELFEK